MTQPVDDHATDSEVEALIAAAVLEAVTRAAQEVQFVGGLVIPPVFEIEQQILAGLAGGSGQSWYSDLIRDAAEWSRTLAQDINRELRESVAQALADGGTKQSGRNAARGVANDSRWAARSEVWAATVTTMFVNRVRTTALDATGTRKRWVSRGDERTRTSHRLVDGKVAHPAEYFTVGGYRALYPGDPTLPPQERINCRCRVIAAE